MDEDRRPPARTPDELSENDQDGDGRHPGFLARLMGIGGRETSDEVQELGEIGATPAERRLVANILTMRDQRVEDVMIPRADIVAVDVKATLDELTEAFRDGAHSRLPVYRDTLDDTLGFVHVKDVALALGFGGCEQSFDMADLVRETLIAPPSMQTKTLLQRMQASHIHMAMVIDEYGGVDGLVTIEDLVEQIVGEIEDEHDVAEAAAWRRERDGVYVCNARAELKAFEKEAGVDLLPDDLDEDVETLGGLVFMLANRIPARGEIITHPQGHEFEVIDADPRRINRLRVTLFGAEKALPRAAE